MVPPISTRTRVIATLLSLLAIPATGHAWTSIGPDGGTVHAIVVDPATPTTLYAAVFTSPNSADGRGVYKSTNGGTSWSAANAGIETTSIVALVMHPTNHALLYGLLPDGGVVRTTNGGATWTTIGIGLQSENAGLVLDPVIPATLYVGSGSGVFKSTNGGGSFTPQNSGLASTNVHAIAIAPTSPPTLYVSTFAGVYKSTDGAASWTPSNSGLPAIGQSILTVDATTPTTLYAAGCGSAGVFRSTDGGASWNPANTGLPNATACVTTLASSPTVPGQLFLGARDDAVHPMFFSVDSGVTWVSSGELDGHVIEQFAFDPTSGQRMYVGTEGGFFFTTDAGATWALSMTGIRHPAMLSVTLDPSATHTLYAYGVADGPGSVLKSTDAGVSWREIGPLAQLPASTFTMKEFVVNRVVVDPTDGQRVYLATQLGVFRSSDGGATWLWSSEITSRVLWISVDPLAPATVYAATYGQGIMKSTDAGASWTARNSGMPNQFSDSIVADPQISGVVYATSQFQGVFKSVDGALSWSGINSGLPGPFTQPFGDIVVAPTSSNILYVFAGPPYRSMDGGASWTSTGSQYGSRLRIDPTIPTTLYDVFDVDANKSIDAGATWLPISPAGLKSDIQDLTVDPVTGTTLYAATFEGIYRTTPDAGACTTAADCNDLDACTTDVCDPGAPGADTSSGCVNTPVVCDVQCHEGGTGSCNSTSGACEFTTLPLPNGTPCDDGDLCTFDRCLDGVCSGNQVPDAGCEEAGTTRFQLRRKGNPAMQHLTWKWSHGAAFFNSPRAGAQYTLCVYDRSGAFGAPQSYLSAAAAVGTVDCGSKPCWTASGGGFTYTYKDRAGTHDGLTTLKLVGGNPPKARIIVQGKGAGLALAPLPLVPRITVQLHARSGSIVRCWGADYDPASLTHNDAKGLTATTH